MPGERENQARQQKSPLEHQVDLDTSAQNMHSGTAPAMAAIALADTYRGQ